MADMFSASMLEDAIKSAQKLVARGYKIGGTLAKRHPVSALVLFAIAQMGVEEWAESLLEIEKATAKPVTDMQTLVKDMRNDVNYARLVADKVNAMMPSAGYLRDMLPNEMPEALDATLKVLEQRWSKRRGKLDSASLVEYDGSIADRQLNIATVQAISATFGLRGSQNIMDLHSALRAFVNTKSEDVKAAVLLIEAAS
jgi:hypothetical protein